MGAPFAAQFYRVAPDLITCAKGMASGVPMGGVLMNAAVAAALKPGDLGSTFGGGPLAGLPRRLGGSVPVPLIDGTQSAIGLLRGVRRAG